VGVRKRRRRRRRRGYLELWYLQSDGNPSPVRQI